MTNSEFKLKVLSAFEPLSEEEQKVMLYIFIDMYLDVASKKGKTALASRNTSEMVMDLLTESKVFKTKQFLLSMGKKKMKLDKDLRVWEA